MTQRIGATVAILVLAVAGTISAQTTDSLAARRDSLVNAVLATISDRENEPAGTVFKNLKLFSAMPAGRIPRLMNIGFGKSLGVSCEHCHDISDFSKDDKKQKLVAREMWKLMGMLNDSILPKIKGIESEKPIVNCTTCHRGQKKPALNM
jgi:hypothetical protein